MRPLLALAVLALTACGAPDEEPTEPAQAAPLTVDQHVEQALAHASAQWTASVGFAPAVAFVQIEQPDGDTDRTMAMWDGVTGTLHIRPVRIGEEQARWNVVIMHELGHALGAEHVSDTNALMAMIPNTSACVHEADAVELRRVLGTDVKTTCGGASRVAE